jgi:hypothetical protein
METVLGGHAMLRKCVILCIALVIVLAGSVAGSIKAGAEEGAAPLIGKHEITQDTMVLDGKGDGYVLFCKRKFKVTENTVIEGQSGNTTALDSLKVPCEAKVTYYKKPGKRNTYVALAIEVLGPPTPRPQ